MRLPTPRPLPEYAGGDIALSRSVSLRRGNESPPGRAHPIRRLQRLAFMGSVRRRVSRDRALLGIGLLVVLLSAPSASGREGQETGKRCTHGVSSIDPIVLANGKVVGGSLTPHTEACLP